MATQEKKITAQRKKSAAQLFIHACTEVKNALFAVASLPVSFRKCGAVAIGNVDSQDKK
jgi:hypothetical protein